MKNIPKLNIKELKELFTKNFPEYILEKEFPEKIQNYNKTLIKKLLPDSDAVLLINEDNLSKYIGKPYKDQSVIKYCKLEPVIHKLIIISSFNKNDIFFLQ